MANSDSSSRRLTKTRTPGVYRRGNRYVVIWRHRGKQCKSYHATYDEAREAKGQRQSGDRRPDGKVRFGDYFAQWIETYAGRTARGFSDSTRIEYRRSIEAHAIPAFGKWKLADVEPADVRALLGSMRQAGESTSQIQKVRAALSPMLATAVEDGLLRFNPVQGVRIPPSTEEAPEEPAKALTRRNLRLLLAAIPENWRLFFEFLTHSGLRISEAVGLRWEHLDLTGAGPHIEVREQLYKGKRKKLKSKAGKRDVPLSPGMVARLLAHRRDAYAGPQSPVFPSKAGTELLPANVYRRVLAPAATSIGLTVDVEAEDSEPRKRSAISFHTFRHTCASMLFAIGRNPKQVQEWLGHTDPGFTLRTYVHLMDAGVGDADFFDAETEATGVTDGATREPGTAANEPAEEAASLAL